MSTHTPETPAPAEPLWVHATNAGQFYYGALFGWRSDDSPTGWWSGYVVKSDPTNLRVQVQNIAPGVMR